MIDLGINPENFIDNEWIKFHDGANAFPDFSWEIVIKLISPSEYLTNDINNHFITSKRYYEDYWARLANDMFRNGLPVSYNPSLSLTYYRLIRSQALSRYMKDLPDQNWMAGMFLEPGETELHSSIMKECINSFLYYGISTINWNVFNKWKEASAFKWMSFNTRAISSFRKEYPNGFNYLDEFYKFEYKGLWYSINQTTVLLLLGMGGTNGQSPYTTLAMRSHVARNTAPQIINLFVKTAQNDFIQYSGLADEMISSLSANEKLSKSIDWSLSKGFAGESINVLLDNLDSILLDILKGWAKEKALKKGAISLIGWLGGPFTKLGTFLYNAYDSYQDAQDLIEITQLVNKLIDIINEARDSKTVIQSQRSAARMAEATVSIIPMILEIVGSKVLDKLSNGLPKDRGDAMTDAKREKIVEETTNKNQRLEGEELDAEIKTAAKSKIYRSGNSEYNAIVILSNGHQWRRNHDGIWCRHSNECLIPRSNSTYIEDLNKQVDRSIHNAPVFDPEQGIAPGVTPRRVASTEIGITQGRIYATEYLGLESLDLPNPLSKEDFSDTGFDDIMKDQDGNWYIMEYKGGEGKLDPGTQTRPPQMTSAWVRHVIQRIRNANKNKKEDWSFIADAIETKLNNGQLRGYALSTPITDAGIVMDTFVMPDHENILFQ